MKIYGISVVKNEADIISYSLTKATEWVERIFVMDNGSDDGTWEIVKELANSNKKIVPWMQSNEFFHDGLRSKVFNEFRNEVKEGDWWCKLDADEFYIDDPREFLKSKVKSFYHVVCSKHIQYRLTEEDIADQALENLRPEELQKKLKYFSPEATSEVRFFKHRERLKWNEKNTLPDHVGMVCPERILIRHYQYRSKAQLQKRIQTRIKTRQKFPGIFPHVSSEHLEDYIMKTSSCLQDEQQISLFNQLPLSNNKNLEYRWWVFWLRRFMHASGILP